MTEPPPGQGPAPHALDTFLRVFGDVRAGEGARVVLMFLNIFALLVSYYIIKTEREPLILLHRGRRALLRRLHPGVLPVGPVGPAVRRRGLPLIAVGSTAGAFLGALVAERLFALGLSPFLLMQIAAALLLVHLGLYVLASRPTAPSAAAAARADAPLQKEDGFALVLGNRYLLLFALMLILLNIVNGVAQSLPVRVA